MYNQLKRITGRQHLYSCMSVEVQRCFAWLRASRLSLTRHHSDELCRGEEEFCSFNCSFIINKFTVADHNDVLNVAQVHKLLKRKSWNAYWCLVHCGWKTASTFKVYRSVSVVICFFNYGIDLSPVHVLSHQLGHGRPQLFRCDLSISVHVELTRETMEED